MAFRPEEPSNLSFGNDGGVYFTTNSLSSGNMGIQDANFGYRVTQFHSCAIHPVWGENYFLGGTQDNGTQQFYIPGMNYTDQVVGGDGGYCYIFKSDPSFQIASTQDEVYFLSTDGGRSFSKIHEDNDSRYGLIIPWDYDENNDVLYTCYDLLNIKRLFSVKSGNPLSTHTSYNNIFENWTVAFKVSPFSNGTLFVGTIDGRLYKITNAHTVPFTADEIGDNNFPDAWINCIEFGADEDHILVIFTNYDVSSVWETFDGGDNWKEREGNLPNVPIRWGIYNPLDLRQVLVATDLGVYTTEDITVTSPVWAPANNGMPNVRTTMLKIRESDQQVIASTFGRGIFSTNSLSVSPSTKLLASDGQADDHFGDAVATNGDFAIVGASNEDEQGTDAGAVYFYEQLNNQWTESAKVLAPDGAAEDDFGGSVDMFSDLAIVGARFDDLIGSAYIYRLSGNTWNLEEKIAPNDGNNGDNFGISVAISGDVAAVGAWGSGDFGAVYIFTYQAGNWTQTDKIIPADGEMGDRFGWSLDLDGNYLLAGSPMDDDNGAESGSAYIYQYDNGWALDKKISANDGDGRVIGLVTLFQ